MNRQAGPGFGRFGLRPADRSRERPFTLIRTFSRPHPLHPKALRHRPQKILVRFRALPALSLDRDQIISSLKKLEANRRNAKASSGPRSPEGKAAVAGNAITHGLRATKDLLYFERYADFATSPPPSTSPG